MSQPKVLAAMIPVTETLDRLGIDYYVGGAVASLVHGIYRMTADVDIVAEIPLEMAQAFAQRLQERYYVDVDMIRDAIRHRSPTDNGAISWVCSKYRSSVWIWSIFVTGRQRLA